MKKILFAIVALCLLSVACAARPKPVPGSKYESYTFKEYAKHVLLLCNFRITPPEGFKETKWFENIWMANPDAPVRQRAGDLLGPAFLSKDGHCMVLYAALPRARDLDNLLEPARESPLGRHTAIWEIESNLIEKDGHLPLYRIDDYLSVIPTPLKGLVLGSTDSTSIYTFPYGNKTKLADDKLESLKASHFPHCIGVNMYYLGESRMHFKMYLSDEGMQNKDVYLDRIFKSIRLFVPHEESMSKRK